MTREYVASDLNVSLFDALLKAQRTYGAGKVIIEDQDREPLSYSTFLTRVFGLSRLLKRHIGEEPRVGLMLATSVGGAICFFAMHAMGRVPVMINFTAGQANIRAACKTAQIATVVTSRRFILNAKLEALVEAMQAYVRIIYLEDIRKEVTAFDKAWAFTASRLPHLFAKKAKPSDIGVILFTSGSFGSPRGVVLSQSNLVANVRQIEAHITLKPEWVVFNPMPIFHSLG